MRNHSGNNRTSNNQATENPKTDNPKTDENLAKNGNLEKDPSDWVTGDEPMTGAQASYLKTLCEETGEAFDVGLTKAEASGRIDELRARDPRLNGEARRS
jgi:hypothetical protein